MWLELKFYGFELTLVHPCDRATQYRKKTDS